MQHLHFAHRAVGAHEHDAVVLRQHRMASLRQGIQVQDVGLQALQTGGGHILGRWVVKHVDAPEHVAIAFDIVVQVQQM